MSSIINRGLLLPESLLRLPKILHRGISTQSSHNIYKAPGTQKNSPPTQMQPRHRVLAHPTLNHSPSTKAPSRRPAHDWTPKPRYQPTSDHQLHYCVYGFCELPSVNPWFDSDISSSVNLIARPSPEDMYSYNNLCTIDSSFTKPLACTRLCQPRERYRGGRGNRLQVHKLLKVCDA